MEDSSDSNELFVDDTSTQIDEVIINEVFDNNKVQKRRKVKVKRRRKKSSSCTEDVGSPSHHMTDKKRIKKWRPSNEIDENRERKKQKVEVCRDVGGVRATDTMTQSSLEEQWAELENEELTMESCGDDNTNCKRVRLSNGTESAASSQIDIMTPSLDPKSPMRSSTGAGGEPLRMDDILICHDSLPTSVHKRRRLTFDEGSISRKDMYSLDKSKLNRAGQGEALGAINMIQNLSPFISPLILMVCYLI